MGKYLPGHPAYNKGVTTCPHGATKKVCRECIRARDRAYYQRIKGTPLYERKLDRKRKSPRLQQFNTESSVAWRKKAERPAPLPAFDYLYKRTC